MLEEAQAPRKFIGFDHYETVPATGSTDAASDSEPVPPTALSEAEHHEFTVAAGDLTHWRPSEPAAFERRKPLLAVRHGGALR